MSRQQSPPHPRPSNQPNHIITEGWTHVINQSIDDPESAENLIEGAKHQDPTNRDIMTAILAAIHSLQTQIISLADKQASTTSTFSFLADETNRIRVGVAKLQQEAGRTQKAPAPAPRPPKPQPQPYQQGYAPPAQQAALPGAMRLEAGQHFGEHNHQTTIEYAQEQEYPPTPLQPPPR